MLALTMKLDGEDAIIITHGGEVLRLTVVPRYDGNRRTYSQIKIGFDAPMSFHILRQCLATEGTGDAPREAKRWD
jgi:sRNA-binding carbon storage regulator CsrA